MTSEAELSSARRLDRASVPQVVALLENGFGRGSFFGAVANQHALDAVDRGELDRIFVWPDRDPVAVLYAAPTGALLPAGDAAAGPVFAEVAERFSWRVLIGDAAIAEPLLDAYPRRLFRRRPAAREQRFMAATAPRAATAPHAPAAPVLGLRPGRVDDLEATTEFACRLHVEDLMGPPIPRSGRGAVRARMLESITRGDTWVVERDGAVVAKFDLSLRSRRRGVQIAGVYVAREWRGGGICAAAIRRLAHDFLADGFPAVTLHVRADNTAAKRAYARAGLTDIGPWTLAFR